MEANAASHPTSLRYVASRTASGLDRYAQATRRPAVANGGRSLARERRILQTMASTSRHVEQLERVLLRRGVGALEADRHRCADCGRTPLTGEHVHLYEPPPARDRL